MNSVPLQAAHLAVCRLDDVGVIQHHKGGLAWRFLTGRDRCGKGRSWRHATDYGCGSCNGCSLQKRAAVYLDFSYDAPPSTLVSSSRATGGANDASVDNSPDHIGQYRRD
jgi:hypothetical protein